MRNTKRLKLSSLTMLSLNFSRSYNLPIFHYLTHLVVEIYDCWPVLPYLLESSPNLITFDFFLEDMPKDLNEVRFHWPKCLMLHLESVNIRGFNWSQSEMEMLRYFLKNSTVLKKLLIYADEEESSLYKELCMLPKSSTACEIQILAYKLFVELEAPFYHGAQDSDAW